MQQIELSPPERWLDIPDYEGCYQVSDRGRVRSLTRAVIRSDGKTQTIRGRLMKLQPDRKGYKRVNLARDGETDGWFVHRLLLRAFEPRPDWAALHVNHKDGCPWNNALGNIEWCTASENRLHSYRVLKRHHPWTGKVGSLHRNAVSVVGRQIST